MADASIRKAVVTTITRMHAAMVAGDLDGILSTWSDDDRDGQGGDRETRATYYQGLIDTGILKIVKLDLQQMQVEDHGPLVTASPVIYRTHDAKLAYRYGLKRAAGGRWLIVEAEQIREDFPKAKAAVAIKRAGMQSALEPGFLADAGILVERHAMAWIRRLNAPVEDVWENVSTLEGLTKWWLVPPGKFQLKKGGVFRHHWENTVAGYRKHKFIDFDEPAGNYAGTGGMRFELNEIDDKTTMFMFLDTWGPEVAAVPGIGSDRPGGPGTPWAGVAAGWHAMLDRLEEVVNDRPPPYTMDQLIAFYMGYLRDVYRWREMVQRER